jgi:tetratricopeptide (TPR) repeat protein
LTELLLEVRRFAAAETEATKLLAGEVKDPRDQRLLALSLYGQVHSGSSPAKFIDNNSISQIFELALQGCPGDIKLTQTLAKIYRDEEQLLDDEKLALPQTERAKLSDGLMDRMVECNPTSAEAYLVRATYRAQYKLPGADDDVRSALKYGPENIAVLLMAAELAKKNGRANPESSAFSEARAHYEHILRIAPKDERGYLLLGDLRWELGERAQAIEIWRRGLKDAGQSNFTLHQRLAGALVATGQVDEAASPLNALDKILTDQTRHLSVGDRASLENTRDFIRAQWWVQKGESRKALPLLKKVVTQGTSPEDAARSFQGWMLLGRIWTTEDQSDQAAICFEQATILQPQSAVARLAAAKSWAKIGRYDLAIRYGEQSLSLGNTSETRLFLAETYYRQQLALPQKQRDWQLFQKALAEASAAAEKQPLPEPWRLNILRAESLLAIAMPESSQDAKQKAIDITRATESAYPQSATLAQILPLLYEQAEAPADADRAMAALEKFPDQTFSAILCRFQLLMLRKQYGAAKDAIQAGLATVNPSQQLRLRLSLTSVKMVEGQSEQALQDLIKLQNEFPNNIPVLRNLLELAGDLGKYDGVERWEDKLRENEGPEGSSWRFFQARRLLTQAKNIKDRQFAEAEKLTDELQTLRPSWPPVYLLQGIIAKRQDKQEEAITALETAIRLGERRLRTYEQLVELLYSKQRFTEAEEYLAQLQERVPSSANLSATEISLANQAGQLDRALAVARRGVESRPKDPMAHIWLGQVLTSMNKKEEAEQSIRTAIQLAPSDARGYNALFNLQLHGHQTESAIQTLKDLEKNVTMSDGDRAFVLAQGYEQIIRAVKGSDVNASQYVKLASEEYEKAQQLNPNNVPVLEHRAFFLIAQSPEEAEPILRHILELSPESIKSKRMLATLLASRNGEKGWQESQRLLQGVDGQSSDVDQRLQATLLIQRGGTENLAKATQILEQLTSDSKPTVPTDRLLLAKVLENQGKTDLARLQYQTLASREDADPSHIIQFVDFLLRTGSSAEATSWLEQLQHKLPNDLRVLSLRARWLHALNRDADIGPAVETVADQLQEKLPAAAVSEEKRAQAESQLVQEIGNIYAGVNQYSAAERWYRRLFTLLPNQFAPLVQALGHQNRLDDALAICLEAGKTDHSIQPVMVLSSLFGMGQPTPELFEKAEPLITASLTEHADSIDLLNAVANVRLQQQRSNDAIELYRRVVAAKPKDILALNNLATLLGEQPNTFPEAIRFIDTAIDTAGPLPPLLDTKGTILVYNGKPEEAMPLLNEATSGANIDPRFFFHLSLACSGMGKMDEARAALEKARSGKLTQQFLTATDRRLLEELEQKLGM